MTKYILFAIVLFAAGCKPTPTETVSNPLFNTFNEPIDFASITAAHIIEATGMMKENANGMLEDIVGIEEGSRTFENTMVALDALYDEVNHASGIVGLMAATHTDSLIRTTAQEKDTEISQFNNELSLNEDLYKAVKAYSQTDEAKGLDGWKERFVRRTVEDFERNGFALSKEERDKLKVVMDELTAIGDEWSTNLNNYEDFMYLKEDETGGLPDDYKKARLQEDGTYKIGISYPDIQPFFRNSTNESARKELLRMYTNRAADTNLEVLMRMIAKRSELAAMLGFETYAHYNLSDKMAKDPETVWAFQQELKEMVTPKGWADIQEMVDFQKKELGVDKDRVDPWSRTYVTEKLLEKNYGVDAETVQEYFPLESVVDGLFSITQNLFDLKYKKMDNPSVWHEDVDGYEVYDNGKLIGRFYLDLHPRANKYNHAACFPIIIARNTTDGFQLPASALVCNFTAPTADKPALMTHGEVETFFHEFGHVLHSLLSRSELGSQSGFFVSRDFIEAPSQIFENWVWNYESLSLFAKHYQTGEVLPRELFDKMLAAKTVMSGRNTLYQVFLGTLDMTFFGGFEATDTASILAVQRKLDKEINLLDPFGENRMTANFGHLSGYGASYYGYLWSNVFAQDMFSRFEKEGIFSEKAGLDYKNFILAQGASKDEMEMLRQFLGRDPEMDAFIRSLGLPEKAS